MNHINCLRITPDNELQIVKLPYNLNLSHNYLKIYFPNPGNKLISKITVKEKHLLSPVNW